MTTVCAACGNTLNADERFCRVCGRHADTATILAAPLGSAKTSGKAIVSLIFGLFFFFPFSIIAIIFGHLSLSEIRKSAGQLKGRGLAIAGLVLGYAGIAAIPIVLIIAAIAIPNLLRAKMEANESAAVASIRMLAAAEISYTGSHPETGYTCSLADLSPRIDGELAGGQKHGYTFELTGCAAGAAGTPNGKYQVVAYPAVRNQTGIRAFCSDESAVIKVDSEGSSQNCLENGNPLH